MNNLQDQRDWAPYQFNKFRNGQRFIPLTPTCIGPVSYKATTWRRRFEFVGRPTGCMEKCLQLFV